MERDAAFRQGRYLRNLFYVSAGLVLSQSSEFLKDIILAWKYGANQITDAFLGALSIPFLIYSVLLVATPIVLVPYFSEKKISHTVDEISKIFSNLMWTLCIILTLLVLVLSEFRHHVIAFIAPGLDTETGQLAEHCLAWLSWTIIPAGAIALFSSLLREEGFHFVPSSLKLSGNLFFIVLITAMTVSVDALIFANIAFYTGQLIFLIYFFRKLEIRLAAPSGILQKDHLETMALFAIPILSILMNQLVVIIERFFASTLDQGSISIITYSSRMFSGLVNLIGGAIFGTALPAFSSMMAAGRLEDIENALKVNLKIVALVTFPVTVLIVTISEQLFQLIFGSSALTRGQIGVMADTFAFYGIGIIVSAMVPLGTSIISAFKMQRVLLLNGGVFISVNILSNLLLIEKLSLFSIPAARIAGNLSIVSVMFVLIRKKVPGIFSPDVFVSLMKTALASLCMFIAIHSFENILNFILTSDSRFFEAAKIFLNIVLSALIFISAGYFLKIEGLAPPLNKFMKR